MRPREWLPLGLPWLLGLGGEREGEGVGGGEGSEASDGGPVEVLWVDVTFNTGPTLGALNSSFYR